MRNGLLLIQIVLLFTVSSADCQTGGSESRPGRTTQKLRIIPWVEVNFPPRYVEDAVEGLRIWRKVTDTAIVSTMPGRADLYRELRKRVPDMHIIPGLKTMDLLKRFDSVGGWRIVAKELAAIRAASGERVILLDNEIAMKPYIDGVQPVNLDRLRTGLSKLPRDIDYLWYPSIFGKDDKQRRNAEVCRVVEEVLKDVRFLDQRYQGIRAVTDRARIAADKRLKAIARKPTLPMLYFYGSDGRYVWWKDEQVHEALEHIRREWGDSADVVIYPGVKRWVEAASSISRRIPLIDRQRRP